MYIRFSVEKFISINLYYSSNKEYQKTYADKATTEKRIKEIALPKAKWTIEQYIKINGISI